MKFYNHHTFIVWPPYLAKQTLLLVSVLSVYASVATSWCRSEYFVWGRQGWSSSILERKLTAHTTAISSSKRVCCLTWSICRHYRWTLQQDGAPAHIARTAMDYLKKSTSTSLNLTCGLQIALMLIPWITLFKVLFSNESTTNDNSKRWKNWSEWYSPNGQKLSQRFIHNSINEWRRRLEAVIKNGGGHIEHCNSAWAAAHHFNTIERQLGPKFSQ